MPRYEGKIMSDIDYWPSQKHWEEILESVAMSKFWEDRHGKTFVGVKRKYKKEIEFETEILFADTIINWLGDKLRLTNILDDLIEGITDDTHNFSRYLSRVNTQHQVKARNTSTFTWNKERRLYYIILDIVEDGRYSLAKSVLLGNTVKKYSGPKNKFTFQNEHKLKFDSSPKTKQVSFNSLSNFKIDSHKRALTKWFRESYVFTTEKLNQSKKKNSERKDTKLTPLKYLEALHDEISNHGNEQYQIQIDEIKSEISKLTKIQKSPTKDDSCTWDKGQEEITEKSKLLKKLISDKEKNDIKRVKNRFTRKLNPWLVNTINEYWFDVMEVSNGKHYKKDPTVLVRKQPISSYERYTICLIVYTWFENESNTSFFMNKNENCILKARFEQFFPKSKSHYYTAKEEVLKVDEIINTRVATQQESNYLKMPKTSIVKLCKERGLSSTGTKRELIDKILSSKQADLLLPEEMVTSETGKRNTSINEYNNEYCEDCEKLGKPPGDKRFFEEDTEIVCPDCGVVLEKVESRAEANYIGARSTTSPVERGLFKSKKPDWETKMWKYERWVYDNSSMPIASRKRIRKHIQRKIESIKRFKNPVTYV